MEADWSNPLFVEGRSRPPQSRAAPPNALPVVCSSADCCFSSCWPSVKWTAKGEPSEIEPAGGL